MFGDSFWQGINRDALTNRLFQVRYRRGKMVDCIIGLSGSVCAGKSTLANGWAYQFPMVTTVSLSSWLASLVTTETPLRDDYTMAAMMMAQEHGLHALAQMVLDVLPTLASRVVVVDGLRWVEQHQFLRRHATVPYVMLYVDAAVQVRWRRQQKRNRFPGDDVMDLQTFWKGERDSFTEATIPQLREHADLFVENVELEEAWLARGAQLLRDCLWMARLDS